MQLGHGVVKSFCFISKVIENWLCCLNASELALRERLTVKLGEGSNVMDLARYWRALEGESEQVERVRVERKGCLFHLRSRKELLIGCSEVHWFGGRMLRMSSFVFCVLTKVESAHMQRGT